MQRSGVKARGKVLDHYGRVCNCCGESCEIMLLIDHVNNDGKEHREETNTKPGLRFYRWLIKENFPEGFQTLCFNCNWGKFRNGGTCPHQNGV